MPPQKRSTRDGQGAVTTDEDPAAIVKLALGLGVTDARIIGPSEVQISNWVRLKCRYGCPNYGKSLTCPPFTPPLDEAKKTISEYGKILILKFAQPPISRKSGTSDFTIELNTRLKAINGMTLKLERELMLKGYYKVFALAPARCNLCEECSLELAKCRRPMDARPVPESLGIDIFQTVKNAGWHIEVKTHPSQSWTNYGLILVE